MVSDKKIDVIVVGGGPAGCACAKTIAETGKKVLVVERGNYSGSKNIFGGAVYLKPTLEVFSNFLETAPIERFTIEHKYMMLTPEDGTTICHRNPKESDKIQYTSCSVIRAKFDKWCMQEAQKAGAYFATNTVVRELITQENKVVGIKTDNEEYFTDIVILADGVNSLLAKQIGLRKDLKPESVALAVKEVLRLPQKTIEDRFNLDEDTGCICEILGYPLDRAMGMGFVYTNKNTISIGVGISLDDLVKVKIKPYEILNEVKRHPVISPLIKEATLEEYSAHLIPESGYNTLPKLYADGVMVVGDAAMLINNIHWEGTNLAIISGKYAAEVALQAIEEQDFSENMLSLYEKKLQNSFILKDLKTYKNTVELIKSRKSSFLDYIPHKIGQFFNIFTSVNSIPKKQQFREYITSFLKDRSIITSLKDALTLIKIVWGILK